jgi:hypothetical protein
LALPRRTGARLADGADEIACVARIPIEVRAFSDVSGW